ncbi:hypothetical protein [Streptomyces niveus]|uniref:hypothetical protein n=1 Tax=Streptomyces niveus TaxID=193462 RepID=UPI0036AD77B1
MPEGVPRVYDPVTRELLERVLHRLRSDARSQLSWLTEQFGRDGVLVVPKGRRSEEPLLPGDAVHRWPPCECGHSLCPDYRPPEPDSAGA